MLFSFRRHNRRWLDLHGRTHPEELGLAIQELDQHLTSLHAHLPLLHGHRDGWFLAALDDCLDGHLPIDMRNDFLDRVIEEFEGLIALLRRYVDRLGPE